MTNEADELPEVLANFFDRPIEIGERALDALFHYGSVRRLWNSTLAIRDDLAIFSRLVAVSPAAAQTLMNAGINLKTLPHAEDVRTADVVTTLSGRATRIRELLGQLFIDPWANAAKLTPGGVAVRDSGLMTEVDLIAAHLSAGQLALTASPVVTALLSQQGLVDHGFVTPAGDKLLKKVEYRLGKIGYLDPSHFRYQYVLFLDDAAKLRIRPFGAGIAGGLVDSAILEGTFRFRSGVLQPVESSTFFSSAAIGELELLIHSAATKEHDFQRFFERNPRFLSGLDFGRVFPHPILYKDDGSTLIPDFFLEKLDSRGHAILDLKTSTSHLVVRKKNRVYFAQWIHEAVAQLRYYRDWFEDRRNREEFMSTLGLKEQVFRPRLVLVGGRDAAFHDEVERLRLSSGQEVNFELWTYDDLLERSRRYRSFLLGR